VTGSFTSGAALTATVSGEIVGTVEAVASFEVDLATALNYTFYGSFVLTKSEVTWERG